MVLIDTHAHLNFSQFHPDLEATIDRAWQVGLAVIINVGTDLTTSEESVNLASRYTNIYATVGLHPHDADNWESQIDGLKQLARQPKVVGIGEIGLDYYRNLSAHDHQVSAFRAQLDLAIKVNKPVVLHCRDAYTEMIALLETEYIPQIGNRLPGIIHSFAAGPAYAQKFLKMGFYLGINNMVTYPTNTSLQEAIKIIPLDRMVLETDCPFLPPVSLKGQRCEPAYVVDVARKIAEIKDVPVRSVEAASTANARTIFNLPDV
ncbi:MAG: TatD family hydrolase [Patescibacteria group bacterium]|jgi:TatD DNase family protein